MATEAQDHPNRLNAPKIELCSTLSLLTLSFVEVSKGLPCVAFCVAGSSLGPLHLSRTLYKSALFMQNKPNFQKSQMNVSIFLQMDYENISNWTLGQNKPNSNPNKPNFQKAKMNVSSLITKDYSKKDDFAVRKNKPNSNPISSKAKMSAYVFVTKDYENETAFRLQKNKPKQSQFPKGQNKLKIACQKIWPHPLY